MFLTDRFEYENKAATEAVEAAMAKEIKRIMASPTAQMASDAAGLVALVVILWGGLTLPSLF
jgi:hypothetical protein